MRKIISALFATVLLMGAFSGNKVFGSPGSSEILDYRLVSEDTNKIRGLLEEVGREFVTVQGFSYRTAPNVKVKDMQGEMILSGLKGLSKDTMIELVLERNLVVQIQVVGLPR